MPAILLPPAEVGRLLALAADAAACEMAVDLERQTITTLGDGRTMDFEFDALRKHMLLKGLDAVGLTLESAQDIRQFERNYLHAQPWLAV